MLRDWDKKSPGRVDSIFSSLSTVVPSHLLDRDLFDFQTLSTTGAAVANGDIAFDDEPCATVSAAPGIITVHPAR